jgi:hypothetical protein
MKKLAILALLALEVTVCGCGNSTTSTTTTTSAGGKWQVVMLGGTGQSSALDFITAFTVGSGGGTLSVTTLSFLNTQACFVSNATASGSATLVTDSSNNVTGALTYSVISGVPAGNTITLDGTAVTGTSNNGVLSGGKVTGSWTLTGGAGDPSCTGGGSFTMTQSAN